MFMVVVLFLVAALEILSGMVVNAAAKSAIHQILGSLSIGFGVMTMAIATVVYELRKARNAVELEAKKALAETQICPRCAERVKKKAKVCSFCGYEFREVQSKHQQQIRPHEEQVKVRGFKFGIYKTAKGWFYRSMAPNYEASGGPYETKRMVVLAAVAEMKSRPDCRWRIRCRIILCMIFLAKPGANALLSASSNVSGLCRHPDFGGVAGAALMVREQALLRCRQPRVFRVNGAHWSRHPQTTHAASPAVEAHHLGARAPALKAWWYPQMHIGPLAVGLTPS